MPRGSIVRLYPRKFCRRELWWSIRRRYYFVAEEMLYYDKVYKGAFDQGDNSSHTGQRKCKQTGCGSEIILEVGTRL